MNSKFRTLCTCLTLLGLLSTLGCDQNLITIHYTQPTNAYILDGNPDGIPHVTEDAGQGMFVIYCINQIVNTDSKAAAFDFQISKLYAMRPYNVSGNAGLPPEDTWINTASDKLVPAGTQSSKIGRIIIQVDGDPAGMETAIENLFYKSSGNESVVLVRDGGANIPPTYLGILRPENVPSCK